MDFTEIARATGLRRLAALAASTLLALAPSLLAGSLAPQDATGTIKGRLVWAAGAVPEPVIDSRPANDKDPVCRAKPIYKKEVTVDSATKGVANAFAYLVVPKGDYSAVEKALLAKTPTVVVDQVNCDYVPYATVVHKGQKLTFKSSDPIGHNVSFGTFNNPPINQMLPPNGSFDFPTKKAERRPVEATCSLHSWMRGWVYIVDHPFAVVTKADGTFEIAGVPAGQQNLVVWQPSKGYVTSGFGKGMALTVETGETVDVGEIKIVK